MVLTAWWGGGHNSVSSRLNKYFPGITIFKCICHSIHICASEAAKELPKHCEDLIKYIFSHFSVSAKRSNEFKDYQAFLDLKPHKLLHPCQTRWLSLLSAVRRVVDQWTALLVYFKAIAPIDTLPSVLRIIRDLEDPSIFLYLNFLKDILPTLTNFNLLFQNENPTVHLVYFKVIETYKLILGYICHNSLFN